MAVSAHNSYSEHTVVDQRLPAATLEASWLTGSYAIRELAVVRSVALADGLLSFY